MKVTVTTPAVDTRMAAPADLVAAPYSLTLAQARAALDAASRTIARGDVLGWPPWRQVYSLRTRGTGTAELPLYGKPVETVASVVDVDGGVVSAADYTVTGNGTGILDRIELSTGWGVLYGASSGISLTPDAESERDAWVVAYTAGWLMPGQVSTWAATTAYKAVLASTSVNDPATAVAYTVGSWVRSKDPRVTLRFECTTAGTSGATEPATFLTAAAGGTITDGTVTWTARAAQELPSDLSEAAFALAFYLHRSRSRDRDLRSLRTAGGSATFEPTATVPPSILLTVRAYR